MSEQQKEQQEAQNEEELVITEEDPTKKQAAEAENNREDDDERGSEDERPAKSGSEDETDEDREAIRERRRKEKQERKERREKAINRDKLELDFLRKRNDDLERRLTAQEMRTYTLDIGQIDAKLAKATHEIEMANKVIAKAVSAGNGEDVTQALSYRDQAMAEAAALKHQKAQVLQRQQQPQRQGGEQIDPAILNHAKEFMAEHAWYDPTGKGEDSSIVLAIDQTLVQEGFDPRSEDYWDELRARAARRLPERFKKQARRDDHGEERQGGGDRIPRGGPAVGSGREHAPASTRKEIYISPERKQALIDAGVWDDPVLRMKYVKRYAEYDRQNRA